MSDCILDMNDYAAKAREAAAEGIVLLKNDNDALPLRKGEQIAVFGRSQFNYYKSGSGSGGLVNTVYVTSPLDALRQSSYVSIDTDLIAHYEQWIKANPYDTGKGWGSEPWAQEEMPLDPVQIQTAAKKSETALVFIGRTAGEDRDIRAEEGSFFLTAVERDLIKNVCSAFKYSIVLLNTGNIIDMKWVQETNPFAVLYIWQGGQEGGSAVMDILDGSRSPSGRLVDTIAYDISDYPSTEHYGKPDRNFYAEDIYVGYRYFESFAQDRVLYPFGFGLSYTRFSCDILDTMHKAEAIEVTVKVSNTGSRAAKDVVQVYCQAPQGTLGKPARVLCGFAKTKELQPGDSDTLTISCPFTTMASFDDNGKSGHRFCFVLEAGEYKLYAGSDVRSALPAHSFSLANCRVLEQLSDAMPPSAHFKRLKAEEKQDKELFAAYEDVPLDTTFTLNEYMREHKAVDLEHTDKTAYTLADVAEDRVPLDLFISQLTKEDLCTLVRGEGMSSPKVTAGTASAFGGVSDRLKTFGIPIACCADGPSGIRMDCGTKAFSLPIGTCLACTFNEDLIQQLYEFTALELRKNHIDTLLGPGMNIHRNPLNGRNFEYFSEDPLLSGRIATAQLHGLHTYDVTGTIKHFVANNQEYRRHDAEAVISRRALREIYLKGFEIAVKEGAAFSIMSTYGPVNGFWTSSNYDLLTRILRDEWGYTGLVMTDWWAKMNDKGSPGDLKNLAAMIRSQNDVYMVVNNAEKNSSGDNLDESLNSGTLYLGELQRSAKNILSVLMRLPAFNRSRGIETELDHRLAACLDDDFIAMMDVTSLSIEEHLEIDPGHIKKGRGETTVFHISSKHRGLYQITWTCRSTNPHELAQMPVSIFMNKDLIISISISGKDTEWQTFSAEFGPVMTANFYLKFFFAQSGMEVQSCSIKLVKSFETMIQSYIEQNQE